MPCLSKRTSLPVVTAAKGYANTPRSVSTTTVSSSRSVPTDLTRRVSPEPTILFATRSYLLPNSETSQSSFNAMDLGLPLDIAESGSPDGNDSANEWERWGEESTIELSMLILRVGGPTGEQLLIILSTAYYIDIFPAMRVMPLAPLKYARAQLTALRFCSVPPDIVPPSPTITRDPRRPVKDGLTERGSTYLLASSLDFGDCTLIYCQTSPAISDENICCRYVITEVGDQVFLSSPTKKWRSYPLGSSTYLSSSMLNSLMTMYCAERMHADI